MTLSESRNHGGWHALPSISPREPMIRRPSVRSQGTLESYFTVFGKSAGSWKNTFGTINLISKISHAGQHPANL